jgi:predicted dehydrogenase
MNITSPARHCLIGCGTVASYGHLPGIAANPDLLRLVAVCDIDPEAARRAGERYACPWYTDHRRMLASERLDSATITTIVDTHQPIWRDCSEAGLHVLCEKPIAPNADATAEMVETSRRRGLILATNFVMRSSPVVASLRAVLAAGRIGRLEAVRICGDWDFHGTLEPGAAARRLRLLKPSGTLDCGIHYIDLAAYLAGSPIASVHAVGCFPEADAYRLPGLAMIAGHLANGCTYAVESAATVGRNCPTSCRVYRYELYGDAGMAIFDHGTGRKPSILVVDRDGAHETVLPTWEEKDWKVIYGWWGGRLQGAANPLASGEDALAAQRVCDEANRQCLEERRTL